MFNEIKFVVISIIGAFCFIIFCFKKFKENLLEKELENRSKNFKNMLESNKNIENKNK